MRWIVEKRKYASEKAKNEAVQSGILYTSGMIAGEGVVGIILAVLVELAAAVVQMQTAKQHHAAEQRGSRPPVTGEEKFRDQGIQQVKNRNGGHIPGGDDTLNGQTQLGHIQQKAALVPEKIPPDPVGHGDEHIGHQDPHKAAGVEIGQGGLFRPGVVQSHAGQHQEDVHAQVAVEG